MALSVSEAQQIIEEQRQQELAQGTHPDKVNAYLRHIHLSANIAKKIAHEIPNMDPDQIYVATLLHDIGRLEEARTKSFHGFIGYQKLKNKDEFAARTALIHMFPLKTLPSLDKCQDLFLGKHAQEEYNFVADYLNNIKLTESDALVQLADCLSNPTGYVTLKQRFDEYEKRHQFKLPIELIFPRYLLKAHFDVKLGHSVYDLFDKLSKKPPKPLNFSTPLHGTFGNSASSSGR